MPAANRLKKTSFYETCQFVPTNSKDIMSESSLSQSGGCFKSAGKKLSPMNFSLLSKPSLQLPNLTSVLSVEQLSQTSYNPSVYKMKLDTFSKDLKQLVLGGSKNKAFEESDFSMRKLMSIVSGMTKNCF